MWRAKVGGGEGVGKGGRPQREAHLMPEAVVPAAAEAAWPWRDRKGPAHGDSSVIAIFKMSLFLIRNYVSSPIPSSSRGIHYSGFFEINLTIHLSS